jgi:hypothetical protein
VSDPKPKPSFKKFEVFLIHFELFSKLGMTTQLKIWRKSEKIELCKGSLPPVPC